MYTTGKWEEEKRRKKEKGNWNGKERDESKHNRRENPTERKLNKT